MILALTSAILLSLLGCAHEQVHPARTAARIDHVIVGVPDLDKAVQQIEDLTGVRPAIGGVHPGRGTRNALMSLGDGTYLELLAPDPAQSVDNDDVRPLRTLTEPTPVGWAVSAGDAASLRRTLARAGVATTEPEPGSRNKPDGTTLYWVTFDFEGFDDPLAPFFIVWNDPALHPSRTSPGGCSLVGLSIGETPPGRLRSAIAPLHLNVKVKSAAAPTMHISLACPKRAIELGQE